MVELVVEGFRKHMCESCGRPINYQSHYCRHCAGVRFTRKAQLKTRSELRERERIWKYATLKVDRCPRCGEPGSLHNKAIRNKAHGTIYHYYYVCHYDKTKDTKEPMRWCYVPVHWVTEMLVSVNGKTENFEILEQC